MGHEEKTVIVEMFTKFLNLIENENKKLLYLNFEHQKLKLAFWNENKQESNSETIMIER